jgi:hypothetical protein
MEILWKEKWVEKIVIGGDTFVHRLHILEGIRLYVNRVLLFQHIHHYSLSGI